jgi:hypothetical protein
MHFHPASLYDANGGEHALWSALQMALADTPGEAYFRLPITDRDGFTRYEPDIVLVLPGRAVVVIECKACRIENLLSIRGSTWEMEGWYRPIERPAVQAREQAIALKAMLEMKGVTGLTVATHVALPFVTRAEWTAKFGAQHVAGDSVLFQEDCQPASLRTLASRLDSARTLEADGWKRLAELLGAASPWEVRPDTEAPVNGNTQPGRLILLRYSGRPLTAAEIRSELGLTVESPHTYVVATAALERRRAKEQLGGQHQVEKVLVSGKPQTEHMQMTFPKVLRHFLRRRVLSRSEERVLMHRAIAAVAHSDDLASAQLKHDVFAWRDLLGELEERGVDLAVGSHPEEPEWAAPELRELAVRLQQAFRKERQHSGSAPHTFEAAARTYLRQSYEPTPHVILEGFTHLTPLQHFYIKRCLELGATVCIVQPYSTTQDRGFAALDNTYSRYLPCEVRTVATDPISACAGLAHLQSHLFASNEHSDAPSSEGVEIRAFAHPNDEAAACVANIRALLTAGPTIYTTRDIAVVCADPGGMLPLLKEAAAVAGVPDLFTIPPRQLLLTPVGRFALTLYDVWRRGALDLMPEHFATVLASGWLGAVAQQSVEPFMAVAAQQLMHCRTEADWEAGFARVSQQRRSGEQVLGPAFSRLPTSVVDDVQLATWREALTTIIRLCRRLFHSGAKSIGEHIAVLLDEIERLDPSRVLKAEREVLEGIRVALEDLARARSLAMEAEEFGDVLNGLIREREDEDPDGTQDPEPIARVWVVGPEAVDNITQEIIFFLGLSDRRVPAPACAEWPDATVDVDAHSDRERYRFLAVVRAATQRLVLSYATRDWEHTYGSSPYLEHVHALLNAPAPADPAAATLSRAKASSQPAPRAMGVRRDRYDAAELAIFRLCPHRYKLELLSGWARVYTSELQLGWLAQGAWLAATFARMIETGVVTASPADFRKALNDCATKVRDNVVDRFRGLADLDWASIRRAVDEEFEYVVGSLKSSGPYAIVSSAATPPYYEIRTDDHHTVVIEGPCQFQCQDGGYLRSLWVTDRSALWLLYGTKPDTPARPAPPGLFQTQYDAVTWWQELMLEMRRRTKPPSTLAAELSATVQQIEQGSFDKNPGDHCVCCPVRDTCMGLQP